MKLKQACIAIAACAALALGVIATAEGPDAKNPAFKARTPIAVESVGPTSLSIESRIEYSKAALRVSGPQGFQLRAQFDGDEAVQLDLLEAEWAPTRSRKGRKARSQSIDTQNRSGLPDGRYRYEIHFFNKEEKARYFSGQFFVEKGVAVSRDTVRSRQKEARQDLAKPLRQRTRPDAKSAPVSTEGLLYPDYLYLIPYYSPNTFVSLRSFDFYTYSSETFTLLNYSGDLVIGSGMYTYAFPYPDPNYFTPAVTIPRPYVSPYGTYASLGVGTTYPYATLDLTAPYFVSARFNSPGYGSYFQWEVFNGNFDIYDTTTGGYPITIEPGVPSGAYPIWINNLGRVGSGTTTPGAPIDVEANTTSIGFGNAVARLANSAGAVAFQLDANSDGTFWNFSSISGDSSFRISRSGTGNTEMQLSQSGNLSIYGDLSIGGTCTGCDAVFQAGYDLMSIEEHAALMWENGHLPAVGPTEEGKTRISVFEKTTGMLNELEKAHIYIEQLHQHTKQLREHSLQQEATIRELEARLEALERVLKAE